MAMKRAFGGNAGFAQNKYFKSDCPQEVKDGLVLAVQTILMGFHGEGQEVIPGSIIAKSLGADPSTKQMIDVVKPAYGNKGWLSKFLAEIPDIEDVPMVNAGKDPQYRIRGTSTGTPQFTTLQLQKGFVDHANEEVVFPAEVVDQVAAVTQRAMEILAEADSKGQGYLCSSMIRLTMPELKDSIQAIGNVMPKKQKGILGKILSQEASIEKVEVDGHDEPCYRLVGTTNPLVGKQPKERKPPNKGGGGKGASGGGKSGAKGGWGGKGGKGDFGAWAADMAYMMDFVSQSGMANGAWAGQMASMMEVVAGAGGKGGHSSWSPQNKSEHGGKDKSSMAKGGQKGMNKGSIMPAKGAAGGKGKSGFGDGDDEFARLKDQVTQLPPQFAMEGYMVLSAVHSALSRLQVHTGSVACSVLSNILTQEQPAAVNTVKQAFKGKGWLRKFLGAEPSIETILLAGKDEPYFRLATG
jgi:hypothetical protein